MKTTISKALLAGALVSSFASLPTLALAQVSGWGGSQNGQLLVQKYEELSPVPLAGLDDARGVASLGGVGALAIRGNGTVVGWGRNQNGLLGSSPEGTIQLVPETVPGLNDVVEIGTTILSAYAVTKSRDLYTWGFNYQGQTGQGALTLDSPVALVGHLGAGDRVVPGENTLFIVRADGTLVGTGYNYYWSLNLPDRSQNQYSFVTIPGIPPVKDVSSTNGETLAVTADGNVLSWGSTPGSFGTYIPPTPVPGLSNIVKVYSGGEGSVFGADFALDAQGQVWSWGDGGSSGRLGRPFVIVNNEAPAVIPNLPPIAKLVVTRRNVFALATDGSLWSWGYVPGPLGYPVPGGNPVGLPRRVPGLSPVGAFAADYGNAYAIAATSRLTGLALAETTTRGYRNVKGTVTLDKPAGPGGVRVALSCRTFGTNVPNGLPTSGSALKLTALPSPRPTLKKVWRVRNTTNVTRYLTAWTVFAPTTQNIVVAPNSDAYFVSNALPCGIPSLEVLFEGSNYVALNVSTNAQGDTPLNVFANYAVPAEVVVPEGATSVEFDAFANEVPVDASAEIVATKGDATFAVKVKTLLESDRPKP